MPLYKNEHELIPFKGEYKPVNIYMGDKKISGWENRTFDGTELHIPDTYNDYFSELILSGRYHQDAPSIDNPVYPTFAGNCKLAVDGQNIFDAASKTQNYTTGLRASYSRQTGILTLDGTTATSQIIFFISLLTEFLPGIYTFQVIKKSGYASNENNISMKCGTYSTFAVPGTHSFTIAEAYPSHLTTYIESGTTFDDYQLKIKLFKGTHTNDEVDIPLLRATDFYADSYNILTGQVETIVDETILTSADGFGVHYRNNFNYVDGVLTYFSAFWLTEQLSTSGYGFCSHLLRYDAEKHGNYFYPTFAESFFFGSGTSRRFVICHPDLGLTAAMTAEEQLAVFKAWVAGENNNGTPIKFWVNRTTPIVTQLTPKTIKTMPYQTNIYDDGELAMNKEATLKVFGRR